MAARLPKSTPVFKESGTHDSPLERFVKAEFFADWQAIKKRMREKRKRMGTFKPEHPASQRGAKERRQLKKNPT